ncbi:MAG: hypothetical protein NC405_09065 [Odoribacter sp.]|nr:hypothetical protein [Odoribacter sp.]
MDNVNAALLPKHGAPTGDKAVVKCINLRPSDNGAALVPALLPETLSSGEWEPVGGGYSYCDNNKYEIFRLGSKLAIFHRGLITQMIDFDDPLMSVQVNGLDVTAFANHQFYRFSCDKGVFTPEYDSPDTPHITVERTSVISSVIPSFALSKGYVSGETLIETDALRISNLLARSYRQIDETSRAEGAWFMPVLMCLRIKDSAGNVLSVSPPQLYFHHAADSYTGVVNMQSDDSRIIAQQVLLCNAWKVKIECPAYSNMPVYTCEVLATPPFHRIDPAAGFDAQVRRRADTNYFIQATPRTAPVGVWPGAPEAHVKLLQEVFARFDETACVVATFTIGGNSAAVSHTVNPERHSDADADISRIKKCLSAPAASSMLAWLRTPHKFIGALEASTPKASVMAALAVCRFRGYKPEQYAATFASDTKPWQAVAAVTFADGSRSVITSQGNSKAPATFNAVLSYPAPDARSLYLAVSSGGTVRCATFALQPDASGRRAVYIDPSLNNIELPAVTSELAIPSESIISPEYPACMAITTSDGSSTLFSDMSTVGRINAVIPARHNNGMWDYGRARFIVFTSSGIYSLAVDASGKSQSMTLIDSRVVDSPRAVVDIGRSIMAIASGDLIEINGTRISAVAPAGDATSLAWDGKRHEVWLIGSGACVEILVMESLERYFLELPLDPSSTTQVNGQSYVGDGQRFYKVGTGVPSASLHVEWAVRINSRAAPQRIRWLRAFIAGSLKPATLFCRRVFLNRPAPGNEVTLTVIGDVRSPVSRRFISRGNAFETGISGNVGPDFIFHSLSIE